MKITVCQFYSSNVPYGEYSEMINKNYCEINGYNYFVEKNEIKIKISDRSWTWYKPRLINEVFEKYPDTDYVLFLDIDAIFINNERKIEEFISDDFSILMTHDYGPSLVNAGVMLLKNDEFSKEFLKQWWDICNDYPQYKEGLWHDQTCIGLLHDKLGKPNEFKIIDNSDFNSRYYDKTKFIFHAFSYGHLANRTIDRIYNEKFNLNKNFEIKDLNKIGEYFGTDKQYLHNYYNRFYQKLLTPYQEKCDILEIGILDGASLKVWSNFFNSGNIHGIDINPLINEIDNVQTFIVNQSSQENLKEFSEKGFQYDVIIDDGSHRMQDQQITIQILFNNLKSGGYFVIEDLQTSLECRMPEKSIFGWGDPNRTTCLDMLYSIQNGEPICDYKTDEWESFISNIESIYISSDRNDSIYSIIKKK